MKKCKLIIIIFMMLFLAGCEATSQVVMDENGRVSEKVSIIDKNSKFKSEKKTKKQIIQNVINNYSSVINFGKYNYEIIEGKEKSGALFLKSHDSICEYFNNTIFNQFVYNNISCEENDYYITIKNNSKYIPYCENCSDWPSLNSVRLEINLPINALENNADRIEKTIYIWEFDEYSKNKSLYLKISKNELKQKYLKTQEEKQQKENYKKILAFSFLCVIFMVLIIFSLNLYKKYKKNKLEY